MIVREVLFTPDIFDTIPISLKVSNCFIFKSQSLRHIHHIYFIPVAPCTEG